MNRILVRFACVLLAGALVATPGTAGLFDWLKLPEIPATQPAPPKPPIIDSYKAFMTRLYQLNTPEAIKSLNIEMDEYKTKSIKIRVYKIPGYCQSCEKNFYVVRGTGVVADHPTYDKEIILSYSQVMMMYPYFQDGRLDFFDRWQLYAIYKVG